MSDEPATLFDDVLALLSDWEQIDKAYRDHAAALFNRGRTGVGARTGPGRQLVYDLTTHVLAGEQIRACMDGLESVLRVHEERRVSGR